MNDLHTASIALDLAERVGASALVNDVTDRNDVDLNRIGAAHDGAPQFLSTMAELVETAIAAHGRATLLTIHGWNVVQPAVDIGLGASPTPDALAGRGNGAVGELFATTHLPALVAALTARDVRVTPGLRYPARARENLLQLFTTRHREDPRPLVCRLVGLAPHVDALQLELALPLRLPGRWRENLVRAVVDGLGGGPVGSPIAWEPTASTPAAPASLEFVATGMAGLVALDAHGGRCVLFPDDGSLLLFTGERVGHHPANTVAGLAVHATPASLVVTYAGPMLRFPHTEPFRDLEAGLSRASVVDARLRLVWERACRLPEGADCAHGMTCGEITIDETETTVAGFGVRRCDGDAGARLPRVGLRVGAAVLVSQPNGGVICDGERHQSVSLIDVRHDRDRGTFHVRYRTASGGSTSVAVPLRHRLPIVTGTTPPAFRLLAAGGPGAGPTGWIGVRDDL